MSGPVRIFNQAVPKWRPLLSLAFSLFGFLLYRDFVQRSSLRELFIDPDAKTNVCIDYERDISARPEQTRSRKNLLLGLPSFAKYAEPFSLPKRKIPTQIIWGRRNGVMKPSLGEWLAKYLGTHVEWMEKSLHMPMSDEPARFNEVIDGFHRPSRASSA